MAKCSSCGRKGLFLRLKNGICNECNVMSLKMVDTDSLDISPKKCDNKLPVLETEFTNLTAEADPFIPPANTLHSEKQDNLKNQFDSCAKSIRDSTMQYAKQSGCDLVVFHDYGRGCCEECAKYRGRVYSISGKNRVFPALPAYVMANGNFHPGCRCCMTTYFNEDTIFYKGIRTDAVEASTRPWEDDRSEHEKSLYIEYVDRTIKEAIENENRERDRIEYQKILSCIPELAPKSFSSYRRMKNSKTPNFIKLVDAAKNHGVDIL